MDNRCHSELILQDKSKGIEIVVNLCINLLQSLWYYLLKTLILPSEAVDIIANTIINKLSSPSTTLFLAFLVGAHSVLACKDRETEYC